MKLSALLKSAGIAGAVEGSHDPEIRGLSADSRRVKPGWLFGAFLGSNTDGRLYVEEAIEKGAVAIALAEGESRKGRVPNCALAEAQGDWARLAAAFWGAPSTDLDVVGVTGTNGKTTTTWMVAAMLEALRGACGLIGTIEVRTKARTLASAMTTPAPEDMHRYLAEMRDAGVSAAACEISSHALAQDRCAGLRLRAAAYTSLGRDHLDYHGDVAAYRAAKARMVELLEPGAVLVVNADDEFVRQLKAPKGVRVLRYSQGSNEAELSLVSVEEKERAMLCEMEYESARATVALPMFGEHNRENLLAATGLGLALNYSLHEVARGLGAFTGLPGRYEMIPTASGMDCAIDYAHTPDAFARVLAAVRGRTQGRLILVFGCGGDKDQGKRALMGALAEEHADLCILTADNSRSEETTAIIDDIRSGMQKPEAAMVVIDRQQAIESAIAQAQSSDFVLVCGKGHETTQVMGDVASEWSDAASLRQALEKKGKA